MTPEGRVKKLLKKELDSSYNWWTAISDRFRSGLPDFIAIQDGQFVAFETKALGKNLTKLQASIAKQIMKAGGEYMIVTVNERRNLVFKRA